MRLPKLPTFVNVKVPFWVSSGFNLPFRAASAKPLTLFVKPAKFIISAFFITGTIKFPEGKAAAIPIFKSFLMIILVPSTDELTIGKSRNALHIASTNIGVNVMFSPYFA